MAGEKILIIEDNLLNLELVRDLLEVAGYSVCQAETAEEGITLARGKMPDLILMDINLPGMDGLTAVRELKQDPVTGDIPIVAITAYAMKNDEEKVLAAGCIGYMTKPLDTREFSKVVARFIASARSA